MADPNGVPSAPKQQLVKRPWQVVASEQQKLRDSQIPKEWILECLPDESVANVMNVPYTCGLMTEKELALTEKDATDLLALMARGELKSYDLTLAFCKRAAIAQQLVNCLTQAFFDEALEHAKELDSIFQETGKPVGPYHGLPFSIKDQFNIKGKQSSAGYIAWVDNIAEEDAPVIKILRDAGAVFFCKTNNPQTLMHLETNSNVHGRTLNPFNRRLTPGGSSGGEGALVGFRGSPIGLGADGGGSIRSPAANNGLFGMKQTSGRVPLRGCTLSMTGCTSFPVVVGPICRSARDNEHFLKTIIGAEPSQTEQDIVPLPWRPISFNGKIKIGIMADDGVVRPHPPILAAVEGTKKVLAAHPAFEVADWTPWRHGEGYDIVRRLYFQDGGAENYSIMAETGEPPLPLPDWVMKESHTKNLTIDEAWVLNDKRDTFRNEFTRYWHSVPDAPDFIICPVGPSAAPLHDTARYWGYTAIFNLLDFPACTFPTGVLCSADQHPIDTSYKPRDNEFDAYNWSNYDPLAFEGAPVCLQIVGKKWECERVMKAAELVSEALGSGYKPTL
ncbi:hypothetical protein E2P81_ATG00234 [Venturia nashicola]|nr:hypothetical protein E2P81_ATG00234 [Venturia nashicola]